MRALFLLAVVALLSACATPLPPADPQQAWVAMRYTPGEMLMAEALDERVVDDGRYFSVPPGQHVLRASYRYEVAGSGNLLDGPTERLCYGDVGYAGFRAGERYSLHAMLWGYVPEVWLQDSQGRRVAEAGALQCQ